jgi:uncharacterized protein YycO
MGAITLQFVSDNSLGSTLIQWYDHGQFSHVDSVLDDGTLLGARNDVIAGVPAGVQVRPASYVDGKKLKRVVLPTTDQIEKDYYDWQKTQIGKPYDMTAITAFVFGRDWTQDDAWFCSEYSTYGLVVSQYLIHKPSAPCNKIAPDDELLICSMFVDV